MLRLNCVQWWHDGYHDRLVSRSAHTVHLLFWRGATSCQVRQIQYHWIEESLSWLMFLVFEGFWTLAYGSTQENLLCCLALCSRNHQFSKPNLTISQKPRPNQNNFSEISRFWQIIYVLALGDIFLPCVHFSFWSYSALAKEIFVIQFGQETDFLI